MTLPITGISNGFDALLLLVAWLVVGSRLSKADTSSIATIKHIRSYFGYFAVFNLLMALSCILFYKQPSVFPYAMGWGYALANIFLLVSLSHLSLMAIRLVPRLLRQTSLVIGSWTAITIISTIFNVAFVALNNQPTFDQLTGVTQFHFPPFLGPILGVISLVAYLPIVVLFFMNAVHQTGVSRKRSLLLACGMLVIMVVGPLHAAATNWHIFLIADILNILSLVLLVSGVVYRIEAKPLLATSPLTKKPSMMKLRKGL